LGDAHGIAGCGLGMVAQVGIVLGLVVWLRFRHRLQLYDRVLGWVSAAVWPMRRRGACGTLVEIFSGEIMRRDRNGQ